MLEVEGCEATAHGICWRACAHVLGRGAPGPAVLRLQVRRHTSERSDSLAKCNVLGGAWGVVGGTGELSEEDGRSRKAM